MGVWIAVGVAASSVKILIGGDLSINLRGCFSQQLKALLAYLSRMYCFNFERFTGVGGHGSTAGVRGGSSLLGQLQAVSVGEGTPEFEHFVGLVFWRLPIVGLSQEPTCGKFVGTRPRSTQALNDR